MIYFYRIAAILLVLGLAGSPCLLSQGAAQVPPQTQAASAQTPSPSNPLQVTGRVLNGRTRQPIGRALVQLGNRRVLTDHDGIFRFPEVTTASVSCRTSKPGFFPDDDEPHVFSLAGNPPIELILYPEAILSGSVIDSTGEPVPHLPVTAMRSSYNDTGHHWFSAGRGQTLSDGSFRLSLPAGNYALQTRALGRPVAGEDTLQTVTIPANPSLLSQAIHLAPGDEMHLNLRPSLRPVYDLTLRMEGGPERGFPMLTARPANGTPISLQVMPNREDRGSLHVALPNGTYELVANVQDRESRLQGRTSVTVAGHDVAGVTLALTPVPVFPVVVEVDSATTSDNATPVPKPQQLGLLLSSVTTTAELNEPVFSVSARGTAAPTFSLPEGVYRLHALSGGAWYVTAASCAGTDLLQQTLTVVSGTGACELRLRVSNRTADLTGTVQLGGEPVAAWVYLVAMAPSATPIVSFRSGPAGSFTRPYLAPGTYRVLASERQMTVDLQSAETQNRFGARVQTVVVNAGDHATVNLNAVPAAEVAP